MLHFEVLDRPFSNFNDRKIIFRLANRSCLMWPLIVIDNVIGITRCFMQRTFRLGNVPFALPVRLQWRFVPGNTVQPRLESCSALLRLSRWQRLCSASARCARSPGVGSEHDRTRDMAITLAHNGVDLVELARAGDQPALEHLLAKSLPDLRRYAKRSCQSDDIEEAVQDALWILYRNVSGLKSAAAFAGWLFQVVRRICLGYTRRRKIDLPFDQLPETAEHDHTAGDPEMRAILSGILANLPQVYREVIVLKDIQGLSAEEMARTLNITLEAAKSRLHRSRAMVREAYGRLRIRSENLSSAIPGTFK